MAQGRREAPDAPRPLPAFRAPGLPGVSVLSVFPRSAFRVFRGGVSGGETEYQGELEAAGHGLSLSGSRQEPAFFHGHPRRLLKISWRGSGKDFDFRWPALGIHHEFQEHLSGESQASCAGGIFPVDSPLGDGEAFHLACLVGVLLGGTVLLGIGRSLWRHFRRGGGRGLRGERRRGGGKRDSRQGNGGSRRRGGGVRGRREEGVGCRS